MNYVKFVWEIALESWEIIKDNFKLAMNKDYKWDNTFINSGSGNFSVHCFKN